MTASARPSSVGSGQGALKVLLLGASGQLGRCLQDRRPEAWSLLAPSSSELNICDAAALKAYLEREQPGLVVNASAYNAVDRAEDEPARAMAVNASGPRHLAESAAGIGARLIHISTDYVFDGSAVQPYPEDAPANPVNVYGKSKRAGELAVLSAMAPKGVAADSPPVSPTQAIVVRTAWMYSEYADNFVTTMLRLAAQGRPIHVVNDQVGTPTYAGDLAQAIVQLSRRPDAPSGIYHYAGATVVSWHGFAQCVFQAAGLEPALIPITTSQYGAAAARPRYSALSCERIAVYGARPEPLQIALGQVVRKILAARAARQAVKMPDRHS